MGAAKDEGKMNTEHPTENLLSIDEIKSTDTKPTKPVGTYFKNFR